MSYYIFYIYYYINNSCNRDPYCKSYIYIIYLTFAIGIPIAGVITYIIIYLTLAIGITFARVRYTILYSITVKVTTYK